MAEIARDIKDRIASGDNIFDIDGSPYVITPAPDSVTEVGTPINKALLQPMEDARVAFLNQPPNIGGGNGELNDIEISAGKTINSTVGYQTVTFPREFSVEPNVTMSIDTGIINGDFAVTLKNITTTTFQFCVQVLNTGPDFVDSGSAVTVHWIAVADNSYDK